MNRDYDTGDPVLQDGVQRLADAFERSAQGEEQVTAALETRLRASAQRRVVGTMVLAVAAVAALAIGVRAATQTPVGAAVPMPDVMGVYVTAEPDADGHCYAIRLYDTTPEDGRAALFGWTGVSGCAERKDNIMTSLGRASGVRLATGDGVVLDASAGAPKFLEGLHLVLDPGGASGGGLVAYPSVDGAVDGSNGRALDSVEELDIPYHAK
jgi:hypothetical protein